MSFSSTLDPLTSPPRLKLFFNNFNTFLNYFSEYNLYHKFNTQTKRSDSKFKSFICKNKHYLFKLNTSKRVDNLIYIICF